jgi:hypothetical protein
MDQYIRCKSGFVTIIQISGTPNKNQELFGVFYSREYLPITLTASAFYKIFPFKQLNIE